MFRIQKVRKHTHTRLSDGSSFVFRSGRHPARQMRIVRAASSVRFVRRICKLPQHFTAIQAIKIGRRESWLLRIVGIKFHTRPVPFTELR